MTNELPPDGYVLSRNYEASSRLNYQHYLWKETLQFGFHPSIILPKESPQIADVATGTAIWLTEIAQTLPHARLVGFDISLAQCPPQHWLPSNIKLELLDLFKDIPKELIGAFDVIHVRLILLVVRNNDPRLIARNLLKMLKPHGYLQWEELDHSNIYIERADPFVEVTVMENTRQYLATLEPWVPQLANILNENGFEDAKLYRYRDRLSEAKAFFDMHLSMNVELAATAFKGTAQASQLLQRNFDLYEESKRGAVLCVPKVVCIGRKPA